MKKDCYISSVNLVNECVYAYLILSDKKIESIRTGSLSINDANKTCMYITDLISQHNKNSSVIFHFDNLDTYNYVTGMREIKASFHSSAINNEYMELTKGTLKEFVKENNKRLIPLFEMYMKER